MNEIREVFFSGNRNRKVFNFESIIPLPVRKSNASSSWTPRELLALISPKLIRKFMTRCVYVTISHLDTPLNQENYSIFLPNLTGVKIFLYKHILTVNTIVTIFWVGGASTCPSSPFRKRELIEHN